jgi:hypothetical protein
LEFDEGSAIVIISASVDNSYLLFGYKETSITLNKHRELVNIYAIESTTVRPKFEIYPLGNRQYNLKDWDEFGSEKSTLLMH